MTATGPGESLGAEDHPAVAALARDVTLGQGARQGAVWLASARMTLQVFQFMVSIVTARLLLPSEFGEAALALAIVAFAQLFTDLGLAAAIVQARRATADLLTTAFWLNIGAGLLLALLVATLAYPISRVYGQRGLFTLLLIASLNFAVTRGAVQTALLERTFNFKRLAIVETASQIVGIGFVPIGAVLGLGAASLVLGPLLATVLLTLGLWASVPWRPSGRPSRQALGQLWAFSRGLVGFNSLNYWARNLDTLLLGGAVSTNELGQYNRAFNLMLVPVQQMSLVLGRVLFPSLSRLRDDPQRLGRAWLRGMEAAAALSMPITMTFAAAAPAVVAVLYGPRWAATVPLLELLALSAVPQILAASAGAVYRALGLTDLMFKVGFFSTVLSVLAIIGGLPWGAPGVAAFLLAKSWLTLPIAMVPLIRALKLSRAELTPPTIGILLPAMALGVAEMAVRLTLGSTLGPILELIAQLSAGGALFGLALLKFNRPAFDLLISAAVGVRHRFMRSNRVNGARPTEG